MWLYQRNVVGLVAEEQKRVTAVICYELRRYRIRIERLIGEEEGRTALVNRMKGKLDGMSRKLLDTEVPTDDVEMLHFFRSHGFEQGDTRPDPFHPETRITHLIRRQETPC